MNTLSKTLKASLSSSSESHWDSVFLAIMVRNSLKSIVPLPESQILFQLGVGHFIYLVLKTIFGLKLNHHPCLLLGSCYLNDYETLFLMTAFECWVWCKFSNVHTRDKINVLKTWRRAHDFEILTLDFKTRYSHYNALYQHLYWATSRTYTLMNLQPV